MQSRRERISSPDREYLADHVGGIDPSIILLLSDTNLEQGKRISPSEFFMGYHQSTVRDNCEDYECILELHTIEVDN